MRTLHADWSSMLGNVHSIETFGSVDGPGVRFVIFLQGCPMRCAYCHNPDTWNTDKNRMMDTDDLLKQFQKNAGFYRTGGITVTGGEPMLQMDFLIDLFTKAKRSNIHTCLDTSGVSFQPEDSVFMEKLDQLLPVIDLVMLDIKQIDDEKHKKMTGCSNQNILEFAKYLSDHNVDMYIRHVIVPGLTDDPDDLYHLGEFIGTLKTLKALDVLPYHNMGIAKYDALQIPYRLKDTPPLDPENAIELKKWVLKGIKSSRTKNS